mmetsp:Transcript_45304/g.98117  ORF Transcript_45304/g.98117 Transcript_45304/m.98117 type:complete len:230 (+) Transcript_45304:681-1370(+)
MHRDTALEHVEEIHLVEEDGCESSLDRGLSAHGFHKRLQRSHVPGRQRRTHRGGCLCEERNGGDETVTRQLALTQETIEPRLTRLLPLLEPHGASDGGFSEGVADGGDAVTTFDRLEEEETHRSNHVGGRLGWRREQRVDIVAHSDGRRTGQGANASLWGIVRGDVLPVEPDDDTCCSDGVEPRDDVCVLWRVDDGGERGHGNEGLHAADVGGEAVVEERLLHRGIGDA